MNCIPCGLLSFFYLKEQFEGPSDILAKPTLPINYEIPREVHITPFCQSKPSYWVSIDWGRTCYLTLYLEAVCSRLNWELINPNHCLPIKYISVLCSVLRDLWLPVEDIMLFWAQAQLSHTAGILCCRKTKYSICPTRDCWRFQHLVKILELIPITAYWAVLGFLRSAITLGHGSLLPQSLSSSSLIPYPSEDC